MAISGLYAQRGSESSGLTISDVGSILWRNLKNATIGLPERISQDAVDLFHWPADHPVEVALIALVGPNLPAAGAGAGVIANPVPERLARVIPGTGPYPILGPVGFQDVFVTAAEDVAGMNASQIATRLGIPKNDAFTVIEFATPRSGIASPVFRTSPGFVGGGQTSGGAREFVIPNGPIPAGATTRIVR